MTTRSPLKTYKKLSTEFYDLEYHRQSREAIAFYLDYAHHAQGSLLEPMCGSGRFLIPILQAGLDVEGFDASEAMLEAFMCKWSAMSASPASVYQSFVQDFSSLKHYKLIFVPYGSWGLVTDLEESKRALKNMFHSLAPGGKFVIEIDTITSTHAPYGIWHRSMHVRPDGSRLILNTRPYCDEATQMFTAECIYENNEHGVVTATETEIFYQYLYGFNEMDKYLKNAGFSIIKKYQDYDKTPATDVQARFLIYECMKELHEN